MRPTALLRRQAARPAPEVHVMRDLLGRVVREDRTKAAPTPAELLRDYRGATLNRPEDR